MAYDIRQDPGVLTPFSDSGIKRNIKNSDGSYVTVNFPNTQRAVKEIDLYNLLSDFHSITGYDYLSASSLLSGFRFSDTGVDLITGTPPFMFGLTFSDLSAFVPPPGTIFSDQLKSAILNGSSGLSIDPATTILSPASYGGIFSISFWVYIDEIKEQMLVYKSNEFSLFLNSDGNIAFDIEDAVGNLINIKSSAVILPETWTHITLNSSADFTSSLDSSTVKLYIDSLKDNELDITISSSWTSLSATSNIMYVGYTPGVMDNLSGMISEFAMWSTRINETEIKAIYDSSSGLSNKMDTTLIDDHRQGVSILNNKQKYSSMLFKISSGQQRKFGHPDHYVEQREFGQPKAHLDGLPFNDIEGKFFPYNISSMTINNSDVVQYPVVYTENLVDPSRFDGVIEPFALRKTITNNAIDAPFHARDIRGEIAGGNSHPEQGTRLIINDIKIKENVKKDDITGATINDDPFFDAQEAAFEPVDNAAYTTIDAYVADVAASVGIWSDFSNYVTWYNMGSPGESRYPRPYHMTLEKITFKIPGFVSDIEINEVIFDDSQNIVANEELDINYAKDRDRFNNLIKSAPSGFVYDSASLTGTDSLAFGGLLRK